MTRKIRESIDDFKTYDEYTLTTVAPAPTPAPVGMTLYDDFESSPFSTTTEPYNTPNGKWHIKYLGYGYAKTVKDLDGNSRLEISPKLDDGKEHAVQMYSTKTFTGIHCKARVRLDKQRAFTYETGQSHPQMWDTFWFMLAHVDSTTHIYFNLKTNGWEIGKKDNDHPASEELQEYITQGSTPAAVIGQWYDIEYFVVPDFIAKKLRIKVIVNGKVLADVLDNQAWQRNGVTGSGTSAYFLSSNLKRCAPYSEQSRTSWDRIYLEECTQVT